MVGNAGGGVDEDWLQQKGYLKESDMKETVVIKLVSDKSDSDTGLIGATVIVKGKGIVYTKETWQGSPISVKVMCDRDVTIEVGTVKMYMKPKTLTYTPSPLYNREVTFTYKALETGTFIIDKNDRLYESPTDCEEAGLSKTDMVGVLLVTDNVAIVIAATLLYNRVWSNKTELIDGCKNTTNYLDAYNDFAGAANTAAIIGVDENPYIAARACNDYIFKNGKKGYLMSVGEAREIQENFYYIGVKLNYINDVSSPSEDGVYWTSTQMGPNSAWCFNMSKKSPSERARIVQTNAFPIYSLYD